MWYEDWNPLMGIWGNSEAAPADPFPESEPEDIATTQEEKVELWRLGQLVRSYSERVAVLDEHDVAGLECLAKCKSDLHGIVKAFEAGCTLGQAMVIFL